MRIPIAMMLAAAVAVTPVPAVAQDNNAATTEAANAAAPAAADANAATPAAADANMMATDLAPPTDTAMANDAAATPAPAPRSRAVPVGSDRADWPGWTARPPPRLGKQRKQGEARQPMLAGIVAGDVRQRRVEMLGAGLAGQRGGVGREAAAPGSASTRRG